MNIFIHICWVWQMCTPVWPMRLSRYGSCPLPRGFSMPLPGQSRPSLQRQPLCRFFSTMFVWLVLELHIKGILCYALFCGRIFFTGCNVLKIHLCVACVSLFLFNTEYSRAGVCQFVYPVCNWWYMMDSGFKSGWFLSLQNKNTS